MVANNDSFLPSNFLVTLSLHNVCLLKNIYTYKIIKEDAKVFSLNKSSKARLNLWQEREFRIPI